jgi:hypothetical protein
MPFKSKSPRSTSPKLAQKRDCEVSQRLANLLQVTQDSLLLYKIKVRLNYQLFIAKLPTVAMLALAFFSNETQKGLVLLELCRPMQAQPRWSKRQNCNVNFGVKKAIINWHDAERFTIFLRPFFS